MLQRSSHVLGKGGCATVYLGRIVAIATSPGEVGNSPSVNDSNFLLVAVKRRFRTPCASPGHRLESEHELMASLPAHPNVMPVAASCVIDEHWHYAMPLMDSDLGFELSRSLFRPTEAQSLTLVRDILRGLDHIHRNGVAHRDVKPSNVLLHRDPSNPLGYRVVLGDFGVAHRTDPGLMWASNACGTRPYQPPEQLSGKLSYRTAASCDMWAVGCVLYQLVTGCLPFRGDSAIEALRSILESFGTTLEKYFQPDRHSAIASSSSLTLFQSRAQLAGVSDATRDLLFGLLEIDAPRRFNASQALHHVALASLGDSVEPLQLRCYHPHPALEKLSFTDLNAVELDLSSTAAPSDGRPSDMKAESEPQDHSVVVADGRRVTLSTACPNSWSKSMKDHHGTSPSPQRRTLNFDSEEEC